jgi:hypothetical protein
MGKRMKNWLAKIVRTLGKLLVRWLELLGENPPLSRDVWPWLPPRRSTQPDDRPARSPLPPPPDRQHRRVQHRPRRQHRHTVHLGC